MDAVSHSQVMGLRFKGTFIEVTESKATSRPRALSDPGSERNANLQDFFVGDKRYVEALSTTWSGSSRSDVSSSCASAVERLSSSAFGSCASTSRVLSPVDTPHLTSTVRWADICEDIAGEASKASSLGTNQVVADALLRAKMTVHAPPLVSELTMSSTAGPILQGSVGHPELCARACLFAQAGACENGDDCGYCHLPHVVRPKHLEKRQRDLVNSMTFEELVIVMLPILRLKITSLGLGQEALESLDELISHCPSARSVVPAVNKKLQQGLSNLSLRSLLSVLRKAELAQLSSPVERLSNQLRMKMYLHAMAFSQ